ncbi:MAG: hydrogenase iron-sulfur subunit [Chitinispirillaceae bacterium]|nr:hydrogenase iron-sulfur subunit [Chitinispirillaceae bacterium]
MADYTPKIVAFVCNWCSYAGADGAGGQKLTYPSSIKLIRVMCSGRVDPQAVMEAYREGADGVMVLGCHPGDCHYRSGNIKAQRRFRIFTTLLGQMGIERDRFMLDWVAAGEGKKFAEVARRMHERVAALGPLTISGSVERKVAV